MPESVYAVSGIKLACLNVRGIVSDEDKAKQLHYWLINNNIDVCSINEWCVHHQNTKAVFPKHIFDEEYQIVNPNQETAILFKRDLQYHIPKPPHKTKHQWQSWISIFSHNSVLNVCSFYHSPSVAYKGNYDSLNQNMKYLKHQFYNKTNYFIINGD